MRLWSIHPRYLDAAGLTACWREGLLARCVLTGATVGYRHHPQLERFRQSPHPLGAIDAYLSGVLAEARRRGYRFDGTKIGACDAQHRLPVTEGQLAYEFQHLKNKLNKRSPDAGAALDAEAFIAPHPMFDAVAGGIEKWEVIK